MRIEKFVVGMVGTNCYLISNEKSREAVIVDPGDRSDKMMERIREQDLTVKAILLTHGHFDHIFGISAVRETFDVPVYALAEEQEILEHTEGNLSTMFGHSMVFTDATYVHDGDVLELAGYRFQVLHTPGHTCGGACYYVESEEVLFSGDTLFCGSVGRTDFPTGSMSQIVRSIKEKLLCLPGETMVYPGHNSVTTIGQETVGNPFLG
jgi:glyoxylase-like metal-dependent hydrolase (beta-lactamase superfamily II)